MYHARFTFHCLGLFQEYCSPDLQGNSSETNNLRTGSLTVTYFRVPTRALKQDTVKVKRFARQPDLFQFVR